MQSRRGVPECHKTNEARIRSSADATRTASARECARGSAGGSSSAPTSSSSGAGGQGAGVRASVVRGWTTSQASRRARRWLACGLQGVARQIAAAATERRRRAGGKAKKTYRASSSSAASAPLRKAAKSNSRPTRCPRYRVPRWRRCSYLPSLALWLLLGAWLCSRLLGGALGLLVFMETYVPAGFAH